MYGSLIVTVEDTAGEPVNDASVVVSLRGSRQRTRLDAGRAPGQYQRHKLEPGMYQLRVSRRGFLSESLDLELRPGTNSMSVVLGRRGQPFFYAGGQRIYFQPVEDRFLIAVDGERARERATEVLDERDMSYEAIVPRVMKEIGEPTPAVPEDSILDVVRFPSDKLLDSATIQGVTDELEGRGLRVRPALLIQRGDAPPLGLTNDLTVQFEPRVTEEQVREIAGRYRLEVRRPIRSTANAYLLTTGRPPSYDILETAQQLIDNEPVAFAEPDLLMQVELDQYTPNDPLFNLLNHLPLIECDEAWEFLGQFLGEDLRGGSPDICIAVFDGDGVTPNHPDLTQTLSNGVGKLVQSYNFWSMANQTVAGLHGDHGTQCAGTATAAFDNNRGTAGVAPNCRLIGARNPRSWTGSDMADMFLWAAGFESGGAGYPDPPNPPADVISNSWGVDYGALSTVLRNAFDRVTNEGRNGRGVVITFSTGNPGYTQFSNVRRFAAYDRTIAVGASINSNPTSPVNSWDADPNGNTNNINVTVDTRTLYNPFGPEMDIVAPSHTCYAATTGNVVDPTTSTVRVGTGGLDGCPGAATCNDYDTSFGGTSHASPTIAGTAALILSVNPTLSWDEVRDVLRRTAVRIDAGQTIAVGQWVDNDGDGVEEFSQWYGYGRVDVNEAVQESAKLYVAEHVAINLISGV